MNKADEAKVNAVLADLWQKNLPTLRERLTLFDQAAKTAKTGSLPEESRLECLGIAHKLSGSLGMFGYQEGTEVARKIEKILMAPTSETLLMLTDMVKDLRKSLAAGL
ncbi:MAG: Hpt domain-containing protein [Acidobacteriota bacterium]|nr:Hpt domain-containing protein [Acidobacteriota bacterium]